MKSIKKENIIFTASHLYLFWTTGVYYLWELSEKYNVVLFVEDYYKSDQKFIRLYKHLKIDKIVYYKMYRNPIVSHYYFNKICNKIVLEFSPKIIYHYNHKWIWNQYLSNWSRLLCKDCENKVYVNAQLRKTTNAAIMNDLWETIITEKSKKYFIPKWILRKSIHMLRKMKRFVEYSLFPFIILGHIPQRTFRKSNLVPFNTIECYFDLDVKILQDSIKQGNQLIKKINIIIINHPVKIIGNNCNKFLYGSQVDNSIVLFPSMVGFNNIQTELTGINNWIKVANIFKRKFPDYKIKLKMHPGVKGNRYLNKINQYFKENCSDLELLHPSRNAQELIYYSNVIVSDVSTILWLASFFEDKTNISMDFSNFLGSDDMKYYDNIHYFDSLDKLEKFQFTY